MDQTSYLKLNKPFGGNDLVTDNKFWRENPDKIESEFSIRSINVKWFGCMGDGVIDDTTGIQTAINASSVGGIVYFPQGTYMVSQTIHFLPNRTYVGTGWGSTIKQLDSQNLVQLINLNDESSQHSNIIIKDLQFDGNKSKNTNTVGLYLFGLINSTLNRVRVQNFAGTGIYLDGSASYPSTTSHLIDCWTYANNDKGTYISENCTDIHVRGGNHDSNYNAALQINGTSCSVQNSTLSGTKNGSCLLLTGVSNHVTGNNVQGSIGHGIEIQASHNNINGNKIYNNANNASSFGKFDGVYVNGASSSAKVENTIISGNTIYAGLSGGTGYYRYAINLDTNHTNCEVNNNAVRYAKTNGTIDNVDASVNGLSSGDVFNGTLITTTANRPTASHIGQRGFDTTLNKPIWWNGTAWDDSIWLKRNEVYELSFVSDGTVSSITTVFTFPTAFTTTPTVLPANITQSVSFCDAMTYPFITSVSTTGFTVRLNQANLSNLFGSGTLKMNFKVEGK